MMDAKDIIENANRIRTLCRNVFSSAQGKELLDELKKVYCDGKLYCDTDRDTVYFIAQRDLILELESNLKIMVGEERPNGEEVS